MVSQGLETFYVAPVIIDHEFAPGINGNQDAGPDGKDANGRIGLFQPIGFFAGDISCREMGASAYVLYFLWRVSNQCGILQGLGNVEKNL